MPKRAAATRHTAILLLYFPKILGFFGEPKEWRFAILPELNKSHKVL
jgi:hypothetical protein